MNPLFTPTSGATQGNSVKVTANNTPTSVPGSVDCTTQPANSMRVFNAGTVAVFVRLSKEATPVATNKDIPLAAGAAIAVMNPVSNGLTGVAVLSSTTTSADVFFTPGVGGI